MSSRAQRKKKLAGLQRAAELATAAHKSCAATLRIKSHELEDVQGRLARTDAWMAARTDHYLRELARYKFIDDMIAEAIESLPPEHRAYIMGSTRHVDKGWPYLEVIQMPDTPISELANVSPAEFNKMAVDVLRSFAWHISEDTCRHRIQLCYDGEKYMTYALPNHLAEMNPRQAMSFLRRELAPAFYRLYMSMVGEKEKRDGITF